MNPATFLRDTALADLKPWLNPDQFAVLGQLTRSEEGPWFIAKAVELAATIAAMPETYVQDGLGDQAIVHLHYFTGGADWFLTEKDQGSPDDGPEDFQSQAFGLADLFQDGGELGYLCLPEILAAGAELDFHWTPKTLAEVRRQRALATAPTPISPLPSAAPAPTPWQPPAWLARKAATA